MRKLILSAAAALALLFTSGLQAQQPTPKPQPATATYGVDQLALFPVYDRASYESAMGSQAPAFDPLRPPKTWYDDSQRKGCLVQATATYKQVSGLEVIPFSIDACAASKINLPGFQHFPAYSVAPSNTTLQNVACAKTTLPCNAGGITQVNPELLSTLDQANALKAEIADDKLIVAEANPLPGILKYFYPADEARRVYQIGSQNVGTLLAQKNAKGVGHPGAWKFGADSQYQWQANPDVDWNGQGRPSVAMPVRDLLPNEQLFTFFAGILPITQVQRTDMGAVSSVPASQAGGFTDADRDALNQVLKLLKQILGQ